MRIIGVIDLRDGRAVHARGGHRERYEPVRAVAGEAIEPGDAIAMARAYIQGLRIHEMYVADLDAIGGRAPQGTLVSRLAALGAHLLLDGGISSLDRARAAAALGVGELVVGLETLPSYAALEEICAGIAARIAFSLDLRDGVPLAGPTMTGSRAPEAVAGYAAGAGARTVIVLDLARVGTGAGIDLDLIARVRKTIPGLTLLAGGGVHDADDIRRLEDAGCDGVLVGSALIEGRLRVTESGVVQGSLTR